MQFQLYIITVQTTVVWVIVNIEPMRVEMSESLAKVATFHVLFCAYSLDDTASPSDDLATESGINKNNGFCAESLGPFELVNL